ncbi:DUF6765 family protein [Aerosakkonema funiforme]|uniref:Uncharacterized protein n=1 Tax=Aerosakkonema funiforme FACHB-1375 TaxID=2949571 RepID=A0A926VG12_9CYAN|nr:DUF6765 family protein [Aerosakkonema funiforme]MBD2183028.1 hypothetical protein [Aerosakkonema funiforme FACHB-1375]
MDQDFHYYGTYYAARIGGNYSQEDANVIAKASNFIDFLSNEKYAGYWHIVSNTAKSSDQNYDVVAKVDYPRYTFQGTLSTGASGSSGLWSSFHFPPGNYSDPPNTPSKIDVHGEDVAALLPDHQVREVNPDSSLDNRINSDIGKLLNRPQSALSRATIRDTIRCLTDSKRLEAILVRAAGGETLLSNVQDKESILKRFGLLLLGVRAHVIGDTWAHQDWCAVDNVINTYWDIDNSWYNNLTWQNIEYQDIGQDWKKIKLSSMSHENLQAAPNVPPCYVGHGWMGHFPDYSFVKYRYKPCWSPKSAQALERDNPTEYNYAFLELCSLFSQANGSKFQPEHEKSKLAAAQKAISSPVEIADKNNCPRVYSANQWREEMDKLQIEAPIDLIDAKKEPDEKTVLSGQIDYNPHSLDPLGKTRYGTFYINLYSDLYLFQIAADYQFHFVKNWTKTHKIGTSDLFEDSWSIQLGPLSDRISEILV